MKFSDPHEALRYHVSGAIARGEKEAITEMPADPAVFGPEPAALEVIGVKSSFWARDTGTGRVAVIIDAGRLARTGEDPYETARYLSSGNDTGASSYSTDTGGGTAVREAATGAITAIYAGGTETTWEASPFFDLPAEEATR